MTNEGDASKDSCYSFEIVPWAEILGYRVVENEVRLFINERAVNNNKEAVNKIYWRDSRAELCIDSFDYSKNFYEKHKNLEVKLFIKADAGTLYSEYEVKSWGLNDKAIEVILSK